jgi:hypothetical protein
MALSYIILVMAYQGDVIQQNSGRPKGGSVREGDLTMTKTKKKLFCMMVLVMTFLHYYGPLMVCVG